MKKDAAFTLIELMITVSLVAILMVVAVPSFTNLVQDNRLVSRYNEVISALNMARAEAIKRGRNVTLCSSDNATSSSPSCKTSAIGAWETGWIAFADLDGDGVLDAGETVLQVQGPVPAVTISGSTSSAQLGRVSYGGDGFKADLSDGSLVLCDTRGAQRARAAVLNPTGRASPAIDTDSPVDGIVNHSASDRTSNVSCP